MKYKIFLYCSICIFYGISP